MPVLPPVKVSIQGFPGSFHDMAARKYFPGREIQILSCATFKEAFDCVRDKKAGVAMVAIENSLAGSLLPNYALLKNSGLQIHGELFLRIEQNLMALPGQKLEDIEEVQSHPMAIIQCEEFLEPLREKGVRIVDTIDTALSAREISHKKLKGVAALASALAAEMYGLEIIQEGVETNKKNFTRFLALSPEGHDLPEASASKASLCFSLPHKVGSLAQILSMLAFYNINLTKIQSTPIIGKEWEYFFYVDVYFEDYQRYLQALSAIRPLVDQLTILGEYPGGKNQP